LDNIATDQKETLEDDATEAFRLACRKLKEAEAAGKLEWAAYKGTRVNHLAKIPAFSRLNLPIGGGTNI
jgi:penicillin amidase